MRDIFPRWSIPTIGGGTMKRNCVLYDAARRTLMLGGIALHDWCARPVLRKTYLYPRWHCLRPGARIRCPGAQLAVLEGNPAASTGDYTVRLKMPDGYRIAPHWHPQRENVTVISGNFKVGMGDHFDESKMGTFPAGSFAFLDPDMHHYAMASGPVVVQVHGQAPLQFNYVNPNDDPSHKK